MRQCVSRHVSYCALALAFCIACGGNEKMDAAASGAADTPEQRVATANALPNTAGQSMAPASAAPGSRGMPAAMSGDAASPDNERNKPNQPGEPGQPLDEGPVLTLLERLPEFGDPPVSVRLKTRFGSADAAAGMQELAKSGFGAVEAGADLSDAAGLASTLRAAKQA